MSSDFINAKKDFTSLVLKLQPWVLSHFMVWLDFKVAEYKINGYLAEEQEAINPKVSLESGDSGKWQAGGKQQTDRHTSQYPKDNHDTISPKNVVSQAAINSQASKESLSYMKLPKDIPPCPKSVSLDSAPARKNHFQNLMHETYREKPKDEIKSEQMVHEAPAEDDSSQRNSKQLKMDIPNENNACSLKDNNKKEECSVKKEPEEPTELNGESSDENDSKIKELQDAVSPHSDNVELTVNSEFLTFDMCSFDSHNKDTEMVNADTVDDDLELVDDPVGDPDYCPDGDEMFLMGRTTMNTSPVALRGVLKSWSCDKCDRKFSQQSALRRHKSTHGEKRHFCVICFKGFHRREHLDRHIERHEMKLDVPYRIVTPAE